VSVESHGPTLSGETDAEILALQALWRERRRLGAHAVATLEDVDALMLAHARELAKAYRAETAAADQAKQLAVGIEHLLQEVGAYENDEGASWESAATLRGQGLLKYYAAWLAGEDHERVAVLVAEARARWNAAVIEEDTRRFRERSLLLRIEELEDAGNAEPAQYRRIEALLKSEGFPSEARALILRIADLEMKLARALQATKRDRDRYGEDE